MVATGYRDFGFSICMDFVLQKPVVHSQKKLVANNLVAKKMRN